MGDGGSLAPPKGGVLVSTSTDPVDDQPPPYSSLATRSLTPSAPPSHPVPFSSGPFLSPYYPSFPTESGVQLPPYQQHAQIPAPHQVRHLKPPPDFFWLSVISTLFCNLLFGFIAVYFSVKVAKANATGKRERAVRASSLSITFNILAAVAGVALATGLVLWYVMECSEPRDPAFYTLYDSEEIQPSSDDSAIEDD